MKRLTSILVLALLGSAITAQAQNRHEINFFMGGFISGFNWALDDTHHDDLYSIYEPQYRAESSPVLMLDYNYAVNSVLHLGAQLDYGNLKGYTWHRLGGKPYSEFERDIVSVLPQVKVRIPGARHFRLYGKAAMGVQFLFGDTDQKPVRFAWEVVPIGAEWGGNRVYGTAELAFGKVINGGRLGIGFRF